MDSDRRDWIDPIAWTHKRHSTAMNKCDRYEGSAFSEAHPSPATVNILGGFIPETIEHIRTKTQALFYRMFVLFGAGKLQV